MLTVSWVFLFHKSASFVLTFQKGFDRKDKNNNKKLQINWWLYNFCGFSTVKIISWIDYAPDKMRATSIKLKWSSLLSLVFFPFIWMIRVESIIHIDIRILRIIPIYRWPLKGLVASHASKMSSFFELSKC